MSHQRFFTTKEVAGLMRVEATTVHRRHCVCGDFWGVMPVKMPNGKLLWPADAIEALIGRHEAGRE